MDNKKWYKRISTCFWFILASLPIFLSICGYIGQFLGKVFVDNQTTNDLYVQFSFYINELTTFITNYTPQALKDVFTGVFELIDSNMNSDFAICFAWFSWVYFIELLVDFVIWLPKMLHCYMTKWGEF